MSRSVERRVRGLRFLEVAFIELLRDDLRFAEADWNSAVAAFTRFAAAGQIRQSVITEQVHDEHHAGARSRWQQLQERLPI